MIVDFICNDLSMVVKKVWVKCYCYVEVIIIYMGSFLQISIEIEGQLLASFYQYLGDLFFKLLLVGFISGVLKQKMVEIIWLVEGQDCGYYIGVCGIYDG